MKAWQHEGASHLTDLEKRCAALWFKIDPTTVIGPPTGLIVGEMPGENTSEKLPLFPWPRNSAGGRLMKMSLLSPGQYLGRLLRTNLFYEYSGDWDHEMARARARTIHAQRTVDRVVLLGQRVGEAFGFSAFFAHEVRDDVHYVCIPHPSGRNRIYNEQNARVGARAAVQFAASLNVKPEEGER